MSLREFSWLITVIRLLFGLQVIAVTLGAFSSVLIRGNVIESIQVLRTSGIVGMFVLLFFVVLAIDSCWQMYFATYKAKGINKHWLKIFRTKYAYHRWLKPIYVVFVCFQIFGFIIILVI